MNERTAKLNASLQEPSGAPFLLRGVALTTETDLPETLTAGFYELHSAEATRVATVEWKRSHIFAIEDVEQAIWEHAISNWKHYAEASVESITKWMTRAARDYVRKERVAYMYQTGTFIYTPALVAAYLESCAWEPIEEVPDVDARVDLIEAFELLRKSAPSQAAAVFKRYGLKEREMSDAEQRNAARGVDSLCHRLNSGLRLQAESVDFATSQEV